MKLLEQSSCFRDVQSKNCSKILKCGVFAYGEEEMNRLVMAFLLDVLVY